MCVMKREPLTGQKRDREHMAAESNLGGGKSRDQAVITDPIYIIGSSDVKSASPAECRRPPHTPPRNARSTTGPVRDPGRSLSARVLPPRSACMSESLEIAKTAEIVGFRDRYNADDRACECPHLKGAIRRLGRKITSSFHLVWQARVTLEVHERDLDRYERLVAGQVPLDELATWDYFAAAGLMRELASTEPANTSPIPALPPPPIQRVSRAAAKRSSTRERKAGA